MANATSPSPSSAPRATYYNEIAPFPAKWLRNLMRDGHLEQGTVDERSIRDVRADDLAGFRRCHFFAGIGGWELALQLAGWPDDREVWSGSCPCQPFSAAGKRKGVADDRHLWPEFLRLITERRPATIFGEQVASADGREWLAGVRADLEALGYAVGAADLCAASAGAPHIRQRLWWVADAGGERRAGIDSLLRAEATEWDARSVSEAAGRGEAGGLSDAGSSPAGRHALARGVASTIGLEGRPEEAGELAGHRQPGGMGDSSLLSSEWHTGGVLASQAGERSSWEQHGDLAHRLADAGLDGLLGWLEWDILSFGDGKSRRVEPGTFPLAHGVPGRVGRISAYGNAIVPRLAAEFITAFLETEVSHVP